MGHIIITELLDYIKRGPIVVPAEMESDADEGDALEIQNPEEAIEKETTQADALALEGEGDELEAQGEGNSNEGDDTENEGNQDDELNLQIDPPSEEAVYGAVNQYLLTTQWEYSNILNTKDEDDCSLLLWAVRKGYYSVAELLLSANANADENSRHGPALVYAASLEHWDMVILFLNKGANVDAIDAHGESVLTWAVRLGHHAMVSLLISDYNVRINDWHAWDTQMEQDPYGVWQWREDVEDWLPVPKSYIVSELIKKPGAGIRAGGEHLHYTDDENDAYNNEGDDEGDDKGEHSEVETPISPAVFNLMPQEPTQEALSVHTDADAASVPVAQAAQANAELEALLNTSPQPYLPIASDYLAVPASVIPPTQDAFPAVAEPGPEFDALAMLADGQQTSPLHSPRR